MQMACMDEWCSDGTCPGGVKLAMGHARVTPPFWMVLQSELYGGLSGDEGRGALCHRWRSSRAGQLRMVQGGLCTGDNHSRLLTSSIRQPYNHIPGQQ